MSQVPYSGQGNYRKNVDKSNLFTSQIWVYPKCIGFSHSVSIQVAATMSVAGPGKPYRISKWSWRSWAMTPWVIPRLFLGVVLGFLLIEGRGSRKQSLGSYLDLWQGCATVTHLIGRYTGRARIMNQFMWFLRPNSCWIAIYIPRCIFTFLGNELLTLCDVLFTISSSTIKNGRMRVMWSKLPHTVQWLWIYEYNCITIR